MSPKVMASSCTNVVCIEWLTLIGTQDTPIRLIPMTTMPSFSACTNARRLPWWSRCAAHPARSRLLKLARVINTIPETVSVVLQGQKDSIPAAPAPSSEKNACHQYGFSANSIDTSTPALINKASRVDIDADDAREAELNPK